MDKEELENLIETAILVAVLTAILLLGTGSASGHKIRHDYPVGYGASDAFQHQSRAEAIKNMGKYENEAPYMMAGLKNVIGFYPPILYHVTVLLSHLSGLETYDALVLLIGIAVGLAALATYYLAKGISKPVALLALPLTLFITTGKPFLGIVTFGQMPVALSSLFLVATAWAITRLSLPLSYFLIAIFLSGTIMTHTSEALFFAMMITAIFAVGAFILARKFLFAKNSLKERLNGFKTVLQENSKFLIALALATASTLYFWPLFIGIWMKAQQYKFGIETISASFPAATVFPTDFGFMLLAIVIGIIAAALLAVQKREELGKLLNSPRLFALAFSFYMLLAGLGTYAGFGLRAFQTRLFWPITLAPLAGFGLYQLLRIVLAPIGKGIAKGVSTSTAAAVAAGIIGLALLSAYYSEPSRGSLDNEHWEALRWVAGNTPEDARVYVLSSYVYDQTSVLYNTERVNRYLEMRDSIKIINSIVEKRSFNRTIYMTVASDSGAGFPGRKGILNFEGQGQATSSGGVFDMCDADYYIIDLAFPQQAQALAQLNSFLLQSFTRANMTVEYQNQLVTILKNNNAGGDCIA